MDKLYWFVMLCLGLAGCGGGGSTDSTPAPPSTAPTATYSVGGTVRGLDANGGLTLRSSAGESVTVTSDGDFTFQSKIGAGTAFNVTVTANPSGLVCTVGRGSGVVAASDVSNIEVLCNAASVTVSQRGTAVTTLTGISGVQGQNDGAPGFATFACPYGVTSDGGSGFYVSDFRTMNIRHVTADGYASTFAGIGLHDGGAVDGDRTTAAFATPAGIARDSAGNLYVTERDDETLRKISPSGAVTTIAKLGLGGGVLRLEGVAIDSSGNAFVVERWRHVIVKVSPEGSVTLFAGVAGAPGSNDGARLAASFNSPFGVAFDGSGNLFVSDKDNHTIRKISPDGIVTTVAGSPGLAGADDGLGQSARFNRPAGIAVAKTGDLYVVDSGNRTVRQITPAGVVSTVAGTPQLLGATDGYGASARFMDPFGIAIDASGQLIVADCGNRSIRKLALNQAGGTVTVTPPQTVLPETGVVTTLAGRHGWSDYVDGTGSEARFGSPGALAVDASGNIIVADNGQYALLRLVSPTGVVSTFAGAKEAGNIPRDGIGTQAKFTGFGGIATDAAGNLYIPSSGTSGILATGLRKVTPTGTVSTLVFADPGHEGFSRVAADRAGNIYGVDGNRVVKLNLSTMQLSFVAGYGLNEPERRSFDAVGEVARFYDLQGIVIDSAGNLFATDSRSLTIRKITPDGVVSTFAGMPGEAGSPPFFDSASVDGVGEAARFMFPMAMAIDGADNIYVADVNTVRKITPGRMVTTIAGLAGVRDFKDGIGSAARFVSIDGIAVDKAGTIYVSDSNTIRKIIPR